MTGALGVTAGAAPPPTPTFQRWTGRLLGRMEAIFEGHMAGRGV